MKDLRMKQMQENEQYLQDLSQKNNYSTGSSPYMPFMPSTDQSSTSQTPVGINEAFSQLTSQVPQLAENPALLKIIKMLEAVTIANSKPAAGLQDLNTIGNTQSMHGEMQLSQNSNALKGSNLPFDQKAYMQSANQPTQQFMSSHASIPNTNYQQIPPTFQYLPQQYKL